jgi:hypothetical protein
MLIAPTGRSSGSRIGAATQAMPIRQPGRIGLGVPQRGTYVRGQRGR